MTEQMTVARYEGGHQRELPARQEPPTPCEKCAVLNLVDYQRSHVGYNDEGDHESYSEWYCGACGAENVSAQPYPWGYSAP